MSLIEQLPKRSRFDYFLIWGHGLKYKEAIIGMIRSTPNLEIRKIVSHKPLSIRHLVRTVYSYDYAPFRHLKAKTEYLLSTQSEVLFIFVHNTNPKEVMRGNGRFRHKECLRIKALKDAVRDRFNVRKDDKRTEDHVIHASDNESQTSHMLKYLGYKNGAAYLRNEPSRVLPYPFYLGRLDNFSVRLASSSELLCSILTKKNGETEIARVPIDQTPQYACLAGDPDAYRNYLAQFEGGPISGDYSVDRLLDMSKEFRYLAPPNALSYVLTQPLADGKKLILDGVHRSAILVFNKVTTFPIAIKN